MVEPGSARLPSTNGERGSRPLNVRDLGGLPTSSGGVVRSGVLYRGETPQPGADAPEGIAVWPPRTVVDLRVSHNGPHPLAAVGATIHSIPMAPWLDPEAMAQAETHTDDLPMRYLRMVRNAEPELVRLFEIVAEAEAPILVHCVIGKDRTGIVVALLLRAVGVARADVMKDYERTNDNLAQLLAGFRQSGVKLPGNLDLLAVSPQALQGALDYIEGESGSQLDWLLRHGVDRERIDLLRERLTTG